MICNTRLIVYTKIMQKITLNLQSVESIPLKEMFDLGKLEFYFTEGELHTFVNGHKLKVTGHVSTATQYLIATRISAMSTSV